MKLGQRITDPFSKERGEVVSFNCHGFSLRMADGSKVYVRNADLNAARKRQGRGRPVKPLVQDGPDVELSRLAKLNGVSYATAVQAMREA